MTGYGQASVELPEAKVTVELRTLNHRFADLRLRLPQDLANFEWILDSRESVTREYQVDGMPQSFVIDPSGFVSAELRHSTDFNEMNALVEPLIASTANSSAD